MRAVQVVEPDVPIPKSWGETGEWETWEWYEFEGGFGHGNCTPSNPLGDRPAMVFLKRYGKRVAVVHISRVSWPPLEIKDPVPVPAYEITWK